MEFLQNTYDKKDGHNSSVYNNAGDGELESDQKSDNLEGSETSFTKKSKVDGSEVEDSLENIPRYLSSQYSNKRKSLDRPQTPKTNKFSDQISMSKASDFF